MQLLGDLLRRAPAFEELEHLGLARREIEVWMRMRFLDHVRHLPENPDDVLSVEDRYRRDLDAHAISLAVDDRDAGVRRRRPADDLSGEELTSSPRVLGRDDRSELAPGDVTDDPASRRIDQRMIPFASIR
jgi:hypothetical protein